MWFPLRVVLHVALTVLFILSEFWISTSAPPHRRGFVLGIYATVLSLGFAFGPWLFAQMGSAGFLPFGVDVRAGDAGGIACARRLEGKPGNPRRRASPAVSSLHLAGADRDRGGSGVRCRRDRRLRALPGLWHRIGYSEADAALLLTMIGLGNVILQIPLGIISDRIQRPAACCCRMCRHRPPWHARPALPRRTTGTSPPPCSLFGAVWWQALYTIGLAHLGSRLTGSELASANAAFVFCYGFGMLLGPQAIGIGMDMFGKTASADALALFFVAYLALVLRGMAAERSRA